MKTLTLANQKGGVGKSAIACQLAFFLTQVLHQRVLVIDLDHQRNTSRTLRTSGMVTVSSHTGYSILTSPTEAIEAESFVLVPGEPELSKLEKQADKHNAFANNLQAFLKAADSHFDICIIDTNPNPDIRMTAALVVADYALSPIQLNQEALDGIGALREQIARIKSALNPKLSFIGILPNLVERTPFQKANLKQISEHYGNLMIRLDNGQMGAIQTRTAVAEAQAAGQPVWALGKTSSREAWARIRPVFQQIAVAMGVE